MLSISFYSLTLNTATGPSSSFTFEFFCYALRGRNRVLSCAKNPNVCSDRGKKPWGGSTCCFQQFYKDTMRDMNHCGECGRACAYGLVCYDGKCVNIRNDPHHCESCFEECPRKSSCS
ncbi:hypothetical protein I3843_02G068900 [Carya illinoinensis]|uniref:Uncharacterized protein n=1 Tax=Carya illinoinensis TaxID=32201 RepID=A0A8T1RB67_CARIL|nr:hypothetical protein I3760_02G082700 [Carya illinoinensis]KAG6664278.1 hypothetical protein CIPAW_02G082100 [Carya illinoinensis]KAG6726446.1 hypothetical protein I3842_02G081100 [Carya illinoinensis]KAG7991313.1 hypothetical protein I3843_02G068900 [Carya illinoinensis]